MRIRESVAVVVRQEANGVVEYLGPDFIWQIRDYGVRVVVRFSECCYTILQRDRGDATSGFRFKLPRFKCI